MYIINNYSNSLAGILLYSSRRVVKYKRPGFTEPYWSEELSDLKRLSVQVNSIWSLNGRPKYGILNDNRLLYKSRYERAIRLAKVNFEKGVSDKLADELLQCDVMGFWSDWNTVLKVASNHDASIEGNTDPTVIANESAHYFAGNFVNSSDNVKLKNKFELYRPIKSMLVLWTNSFVLILLQTILR